MLFIGEEQSGNVGRHAALQDITVRLQKGLPRLFYHDIPYIPIYLAAGDEIQFGFVLANGKVSDVPWQPFRDLYAQSCASRTLHASSLCNLPNV